MAGTVFRNIWGVAGIAAAFLLTSPIGGSVFAADAAADQQAPGFAEQVNALILEYPNGGADFETQLTSLALAQANPAEAIATMMVALGSRPSSGTLTAVVRTIGKLSGYSSEDLQNAVKNAVSNSGDAISAAQGVLAVVSSLNSDNQEAVGRALGNVVASLQQQDKTADATVIQMEVTTSQITSLQQGFTRSTGIVSTEGTTTQTETETGTTGKTNRPSTSNDYDPTGSVPEQPASGS